jgi:hypothetical protein
MCFCTGRFYLKTKTASQGVAGGVWRPRADSNCALRLRRPTLCPLSYGGGQGDFITLRETSEVCQTSEVFLSLRRGRQQRHLGAQVRDDLRVAAFLAVVLQLFLFVGKFTQHLIETRCGAERAG